MKYLVAFFTIFIMFVGVAYAVTNIDQFDKWAWNDAVGWIDFYATQNTQNEVIVKGGKIAGSGVIQSNSDYLSMDCETSPSLIPNQNICTSANGGNGSIDYWAANDANGNLSGWAWSDSIGWVSFCGNTTGGSTYNGSAWVCPASPTYQVIIRDNATGNRDFSGYAWNDSVGWISFNCNQIDGNTCASVNYKVETYWGSSSVPASGDLASSTFDTCPTNSTSCANGAAYNYILWKGDLNGLSNSVKFQLATSSCANGGATQAECSDSPTSYWGVNRSSGDGAFVGADGFSSSYYGPANSGITMPITGINHDNKRYYRYKIFLVKDASASLSPVVRDVVVNWSL